MIGSGSKALSTKASRRRRVERVAASAACGHDVADPASLPGADAFQWDASAPSSFRFGLFADDALPVDAEAHARHHAAADALTALGGRAVAVPFEIFAEASALLYEGAWMAERLTAVEDLFARDPDAILTLTKHEEEGAFTVEPILRNHAPIKPFVVRGISR